MRPARTPLPRPAATVLARVALFSLAALLGLLALTGARMTSAGIADYQTRAFLADWEAKRSEPSARAWRVAASAAHRAVDHYPVDRGEYLERLGYVNAWQRFLHPFGNPTAQPSRLAARDAQRQAIEARPTWPYAWAALAEIKLRLLEFDGEFDHALDMARQLGPWRPEINRRLAEIGLIAWPQLDAAQRDATLGSARRALQLSATGAASLFTLADSAGQHDALCQSLSDLTRKRFARNCPQAASH